jgi:hypothetical protein
VPGPPRRKTAPVNVLEYREGFLLRTNEAIAVFTAIIRVVPRNLLRPLPGRSFFIYPGDSLKSASASLRLRVLAQRTPEYALASNARRLAAASF